MRTDDVILTAGLPPRKPVEECQGQGIVLGPGLAAIYSFDGDVLGNWRKFDAEMHPLLNRIGAL